ncbi:BTAD domain-containing putative transcriptional regulator [Catellatospora citrea]|uniref:AfsR/SARP family transcriptional regulator n=1 Tax=Catellatospora citrea TaxID=53366 RepID=UPI0033F46C03
MQQIRNAWTIDGPGPGHETPPAPGQADPAPGRTRFQLLGPLTITDGSESVVLAPSKPTILLAVLLLNPNAVVSVGALQRAIWGEDQPVTAKAALQTCAMRLRQLFVRHGIVANAIETVPGGYRILAGPQSLDLLRFRELVRRAAAETDAEAELSLLEGALSLWRGPLLTNVPSDALHRDVVPRVTEERLKVLERASDIKISLGRSRSALVDLWEAARAHPGHERFGEQLIEALYRTGRQADALSEIRRIKEYLLDELGVDPGRGLQRLEMVILRGEELPPVAVAERPEPGPAASAMPVATPGMPTVSSFTGRAVVSDAIVARLADPGAATVLLTGPPGIGKTALAVHVAGLVQAGFPGGELFVAMTGPDGLARPAAEITRQLDAAFGPAGNRPVTGHPRGLLVLDDVLGVEQVRPLLPSYGAAAGNAVVITSQRSLAGLVATHGGWVHRLDVLDPDESDQLLATVLGAERSGAEPHELSRLAIACGHLPLALRIVGARLQTRPRLRIADAVTWLRDDRIARLALPDEPLLSVRNSFQRALARLEPALAEAFTRLGAAADPVFTVTDSAQLFGAARASAEELLDQLVDANLLEEGPGRYAMHELLWLYARSRLVPAVAEPVGPALPRTTGTTRLVDVNRKPSAARTAGRGMVAIPGEPAVSLRVVNAA